MTGRPIVSILTPSFNREDLVAETLDSVLAQTWPHWEMLVIDDGSTDGTKDVVAAYAARDSRVKLFNRSWQPKGACTCRNEGVSMCDGDYVMFLDTDDIIEPFCLENRVRAMEGDPDLDFAIFPSLMFEHTPNDLGLWWNIDKPEAELSRQFRGDSIAQGTGVLWRKDSFERIGMWNPDLKIWQDVELFLRAYIQGCTYRKFFHLPPDLHIRVTEGSLSRSDYFSREKLTSRIEILKRTRMLLESENKSILAPELKFMTMSVISELVRSRKIFLGFRIIFWAKKVGIFSVRQIFFIATSLFVQNSGLAGVEQLNRWSVRTLENFSSESSVAAIRVDDHNRPTLQPSTKDAKERCIDG